MIVLDASVVLEVLLRTPRSGSAEERIFDPRVTLHAPHLLDVEVAQVLRRYSAAGVLSELRAREALCDLADWRIERYPHGEFLPRVWELRHTLTAYDGVYVALAEALDAPLLTCDARLASTKGHTARIVRVR